MAGLEDLSIVPGGYSSEQPSVGGTAVSDCSPIGGTTFIYHVSKAETFILK